MSKNEWNAMPAALLSQLTDAESRHLTRLFSQEIPSKDPEKEIEDYIRIIKEEYAKLNKNLYSLLERKRWSDGNG